MKKFYFLLLALVFFSGAKAQIITFSDANFKTKLLTANTTNTIAKNLSGSYFKIDTNSDNEIQVSEALQVSYLNVSYSSIANITGISFFTNLKTLMCKNNTLTALDVSALTLLQQLECEYNNFTSLTVDNLPNLTGLKVYPNASLQTLEVKNNPNLTALLLGDSFGSLSNLVTLDCSNNKLSSLQLFYNTPLSNLVSLNCANNEITSFGYLNPSLKNLDLSGNKMATFTCSNHSNILSLNVSNNLLTDLEVYFCGNLGTLNFSGNPQLQILDLQNLNIPNLNVSNLNYLTILDCTYVTGYSGIKFDAITISNLPALTIFRCSNNNLTNLNISNFPNLSTILFNANNADLNVVLSYLPALTTYNLDDQTAGNSITIDHLNNLTGFTFNSYFKNLTLSNNPALTSLNYHQYADLNQLILLNLPALVTLNFSNSQTVPYNLNITSLPSLTNLSLDIDDSCTLNLSDLPMLYTLTVDGPKSNFSVTDLPQLYSITSVYGNLTGVTLSNLPNLHDLVLNNNTLASLNLTNFPQLKTINVSNNTIANLTLNNLPQLYDVNLSFNNFATSQPLVTYDFNSLPSLYTINLDHTGVGALNFINLPNFHDFKLLSDSKITALSIANLPSLFTFNINTCSNLTNITLNNLNALDNFIVYSTKIPGMTVSNLPALKDVKISGHSTSIVNNGLVFSNLPNLYHLNLTFNSLRTLTLNNLPSLFDLDLSNNSLFTLYLNLIALNKLNIQGNALSLVSLDLSNCPNIKNLDYSNGYVNDKLKYINLKNGNLSFDSINVGNSIKNICVDTDAEATLLRSLDTSLNTTIFTTYCTLDPYGSTEIFQGAAFYDVNNDGCNASDIPVPNVNFSINDGTLTQSYIGNATGSYVMHLLHHNYTLIPTLENLAYFTISPSLINADFTSQPSPIVNNLCLTANGVHPDLEVILVPLVAARAGFDARYKVIYKNKGNITQSGTVNVTFNDAVLDFVSASPGVTVQTLNNLSWDFNNLLPFETRTVDLVLNVNSPTETPAVNTGDILNYMATVSSPAVDETANDNTFSFNQTVVNAYDPNDKTCLEGATLAPEKVGEYAHYMIRFENNGTAIAQNIVVKDMIDTAKFDINTLVPIKGSHSFVTKITSGNKVEFIFENINLPFDDANNDGYVSFKIKTKPTLTNGDTFSNSASIYFDYNFPIVTNTATTTIQALSRQDFEFSNYFKLYPNPVSTTLNIDAKDTIQISSINIYNTLGQLVLVVPNAQDVKTIDVSNLNSGNYFIKINSDKGTSNTKFIKQ